MSETIRLIVKGYLNVKDRQALENLRAHRDRLRRQLQERTPGGIDAGPAMDTFDEDLRVIEAAINRLCERPRHRAGFSCDSTGVADLSCRHAVFKRE